MNDHLPAGRAGGERLPGRPDAGTVFSPPPESLDDEIDLRDIWMTLRRRRRTILVTMFVVVAAATAWTLLVTPVWSARTLIRVDEQEAATPIPLLDALTSLSGGSEIETELRILRTRPIGEQVVDELDLNFVVVKPAHVPRRSIFAAHEFGRETGDGKYQIRRASVGRFRIHSVGRDTPWLDSEFAPGERVELPGGGSFILADLENATDEDGDPLPLEIDVETTGFQKAVENLFETTSASRPDRDANVLQVGYRSTDRQLVHEVPNAVARSFIVNRIDDQKTDARSTVAFLEDQVADTRRQLEEAEAEMQGFREGEQIVALGAEAEAQVQRLAALQAQRTELETERTALAGLVADIDSGGTPEYRRLASFPTFFKNNAITSILVKLIEADDARSELLVRYRPGHPDVVGVEARIDELEAQLGSIGRNYLRSLDDQIGVLDGVLAQFGADLEKIPAREIRFAGFERQVEMLAELYTLLQTRLKEAQVSAAIDDSSVRVVEEAIEPLRPVSPKPVRNLVLASMFGLMLGMMLAFVREYMDRRLHSSDRIEAIFGLPTMARIPGLALGNGREGRERALVTLGAASSIGAESFRNLRTNVRFVREGRGASEIVITSPSPREGKSLTAANLAVALAQQDKSTLLIDADMRRPSQHLQFKVEPSPGLSETLLADALPDGAIRPTMQNALWVLPAGRLPPNPAELLASPRMDRLLETLRDRYDAIILDSPPVLAVTDSAILGTKTDGVILVVRAEKTDKDAIALALQQMRQVKANVLGVVVNDARSDGVYQSFYREYYGQEKKTGLKGLLERLQGSFS